jgi:hypothetical protein
MKLFLIKTYYLQNENISQQEHFELFEMMG